MKYIPKHQTPWSPLKPESYLEEIKPAWQTNKSVQKKPVKRHTTVKKSSILLDQAVDTTKKKVENAVMTVGSLPFRLYGTVAKTLADWVMPNEDTYKNAHNKFGEGYGHERDNIINVHDGKSGERIRLEMMGFHNVDGKYKYPNPKYKPSKKQDEMSELKRELGLESEDQRKYLSWCAENGNVISRYYGKPTTGNAWTRHGIYGDSIIVKAPYTKDQYRIPKVTLKSRSMLSDQGKYVEDHIDDEGVELQSGDIVDLRYPGSDYTDRAWREGDPNLPNSHTGTIIKTGPKKGNTYVAHYVGGLQIEPIGDLIGTGIRKVYITGIRRPGTKEHPYK